jgi:hypothetical protein
MAKEKRRGLTALKRLFSRATGWQEPKGLRGLLGPAPFRAPRLVPFLALFQELLADLFSVRDEVLRAQAGGRTPSPKVLHQYEQDLLWIRSEEEEVPFSFGWVCRGLGLEPSAVRRRYLRGQPVAFESRRGRPF